MDICIIPARGGSKRIPRKNIVDFCGAPMISYAIRAAHASGCFDGGIWVSTDDQEIAEVARTYKAGVIERPAELADDHTGTQAVVKHAIEALEHRDERANGDVCCIYPTAVMLNPMHLIHARSMLRLREEVSYVFSVCRYRPPVQRMLRLKENLLVEAVWPQFREIRTQDLEPRFHDAGQFYWGRHHAFLADTTLFSHASLGYEIPAASAVDIDTIVDLQIAKWMYQGMQEGLAISAEQITKERHQP